MRNTQLDKEARELRLENENLSESLEYGRAAAASSEEVSQAFTSGSLREPSSYRSIDLSIAKDTIACIDEEGKLRVGT